MDLHLMFCANCGYQMPSAARFCSQCGRSIDPVIDLTSLPDSLFASDAPTELASTFPLMSGNQIQITATDLRIENVSTIVLLAIPLVAISSVRRQDTELVLSRMNGEVISITFLRTDDAIQVERLLLERGVRIDAPPMWAPPPVTDTSSSKMKPVGIGCAVLVGACMLLGIIGSLVNPAADGMTPADQTWSQSKPVETLKRSSNSNVSTSRYESAVMAQSRTLADSMGRFAVLAQDPQFFNSAWKTSVATELGIWQATYREAIALSPPSSFEAFHSKYVAALAEYDAAASKVARGLDDVDPSRIDAASVDIDEGTRLIGEAMESFPD